MHYARACSGANAHNGAPAYLLTACVRAAKRFVLFVFMFVVSSTSRCLYDDNNASDNVQ